MRTKPSTCQGCAFESAGTDFSAVEVTGANGVLRVGEASGEAEARDCLPFRPYAPAGSLVERIDRTTVFWNLLLLAGTAFIPFATSALGQYP